MIQRVHFDNDMSAHFTDNNWSLGKKERSWQHGRNNSGMVKKKADLLLKSAQC